MADEKPPEDEKPKKKGGMVKKLITGLMLVAVLGGGGAAGGYFLAGTVQAEEGEKEDPNKPKLVAKDGSEVSLKDAKSDGKPGKPKFNESAFKATYYAIEAPFTSNLKNSSSFAQLSIAVSTYYDERVIENIQEHETAIRSAVLMTIAEQDSEVIASQQGRETLQGLLTSSINQVLNDKTGFGGVDNVYFTSFVVQ